MKDYLGNVVEVGDEVVFMMLNYRSLRKGTIKRITEKMCVIDLNGRDVKQFHSQVVKIPKYPNSILRAVDEALPTLADGQVLALFHRIVKYAVEREYISKDYLRRYIDDR